MTLSRNPRGQAENVVRKSSEDSGASPEASSFRLASVGETIGKEGIGEERSTKDVSVPPVRSLFASSANRALHEFLNAPPEVQAAFEQRIVDELAAQRDFDRYRAEELDPNCVSPEPTTHRLPRSPVRWDEHWSRRARRKPTNGPLPSIEQLQDIPATEYVEVLTGEEIGPGGFIHCPLPQHDERTPSCKVYEGDGGWYCHACQRGGDVFTLAGYLWGIDHRGPGFREIRERLEAMFGQAA